MHHSAKLYNKWTQSIKQAVSRLQQSLKKRQSLVPAVAFLGGILWDTLTIGRIDQWSNIIQLGVYVFIAMMLVMLEFVETAGKPLVNPMSKGLLVRMWGFRTDLVHFLLGSLLSAFTIFFIKSSSLWGSLSFILVIGAALVANEFQGFRQIGLQIRICLATLCAACYFACIVPVMMRQVHIGAFLASLVGTVHFIATGLAVIYYFDRHRGVVSKSFEIFIAPALLTIGVFGAFYASGLIPPVPLALTKVGIYRKVERIQQKYALTYTYNPWRFWEKGEQNFAARPGDKVFVFFSVFSPEGFRESIEVRWYFADHRKQNSYELMDTTQVKVVGGRVAGYRGFAFKSRYQPGDWQVRIGTGDGREIGRINLEILTDGEETPRDFLVEYF